MTFGDAEHEAANTAAGTRPLTDEERRELKRATEIGDPSSARNSAARAALAKDEKAFG